MFEEKSEQIARTTLLFDAIVTVFVYLSAYWLRNGINLQNDADFFSHLCMLPLVLAFLVFFLPYFGAYLSPRVVSMTEFSWSIICAISLSIGVLLSLLFLMNIHYVSRAVIVLFATLEFFALVGVRLGVSWIFVKSIRKGEKHLRVLIIGSGQRAERLCRTLRLNSEWGIDIIGHLDPDASRVNSPVLDSKVIGTLDDVSTVLKGNVVDEVILAIPRRMIDGVDRIAHACEEEGIRLRMMADVFDLDIARMSLAKLGKIPLLSLEPVAQDEGLLILKRIIDLALTIPATLCLLPFMAIIAIAIKLDSKGPVFFIQERVGHKKRTFPLIKFRTMTDGADKKMDEIEHLNEAEGPIFKIANDPRITKLGKLLRKTSMDELPQLFNIIRGEMSLVGPRPMSIRDVDLFDQGIQRKRFSVKSGLTGLWQISGRSNLPFSKWIELDLQYIENWTLSLDLKILFKTVPVVLRGTGAV